MTANDIVRSDFVIPRLLLNERSNDIINMLFVNVLQLKMSRQICLQHHNEERSNRMFHTPVRSKQSAEHRAETTSDIKIPRAGSEPE